MQVDRLADGLWRWTAAHPDWTSEEGPYGGWEREVACVYHEAPDGIVLIDPLVPDDAADAARYWRALDRDVDRIGAPPTIVVSCRWHARSADDIRTRFPGARVLAVAPLADCAVDALLVDGAELPGGVRAIVPDAPDEARMAIVTCSCHGLLWLADYLIGGPTGGLTRTPASWFDAADARDWMAAALPDVLRRAAAEARIAIPAHGPVVDADVAGAIARALT